MESATTLKSRLPQSEQEEQLPRAGRLEILRMLRGIGRGDFSASFALEERYPVGCQTRLFGRRIHILNEPSLIETVLVKNHRSYHRDRASAGLKRVMGNGVLTSEDAFHLTQRRLIQPAFHKSRIDAYADTMVRFAKELCTRWQDGSKLDISKDMMEVTLAIIARTMFSYDVASDVATVERSMRILLQHAHRYVIPQLGHLLDRLPLESTRSIERALIELDEVVYRFIRQHRELDEDNGDLLSLLLAARYEDGSGMSDQQVRDEAITLFLAGHETTANALTWTWYLLSQHPEIERRLHEEIDAVLEDGRDPNTADLPRLDYTRRVITEAMRICPTVPGFARMAIEDNNVGPILVRKGDTVLFSQMALHHSKRWYPDPERFDPDRWLPEQAAARPKFAFFPFGGGSRKCIGEPFAWMEAILLLATFARDWRFELAPDARVSEQVAVTLRARHGMHMIAHRRRS
ncbi:MAG: hypothetical protein RLZZ303_2411 [Candidatus Hydrogenedentota bacterium]|jgi:cytochrome P450